MKSILFRILCLLQVVILLVMMNDLVPAKTVSAVDQYESLRIKWRDMLTGGSTYDPADTDIAARVLDITSQAQSLWDSMDKSPGRKYLWSNLNSTSISSHIASSYNRIYLMALAYSTKGSALQGNAALKNDIISALDWMYLNRYNENKSEYDNWYHWQIAAPMSLNDCTVLMYNDLTKNQINKYMRTIDHFQPTVNMTGANRVLECTVMAIRGIVGAESSRISVARDGLREVFTYVSAGDGFYKDGSFIQHDAHPYIGSYGVDLVKSIGNVIYLLKDSAWEVKDTNQKNVFKWVYDAYEPLLYKGSFMDMTRGRDISRYSSEGHDRGHIVIQTIIRISLFAPPSDSAYFKSLVKYMIQQDTYSSFFADAPIEMIIIGKSILGDPSVTPRGELIKYKQYASMDRAVHLRPGFGLGLSMHSNRIENFELMNNENLKGWHTADGMTYLYNNDLSQFDDNFWATVDPYRLPGTTVNQFSTTANDSASDKSWVGGVELLGTYGTSGMFLHPNMQTLNARKSWFMFDDEIVALGSGITSKDNKIVETIVENRKLKPSGDNVITVNGTEKPRTLGWTETMTGTDWIHLEGNVPDSDIGYYFPGGTQVKGLREARTGKWGDINTNSSLLTESIQQHTRNYLTLWLDHGKNPSNSRYSYVLLPNMTSSQVKSYAVNPNITILKNTVDVQAVKENTLNIIGANFWKDISRTVDIITCNKKASVMTKENPGRDIEVSVSDPTMNNAKSIDIEINRSASGVLSSDKRITVTQLSPKIKFSVNVENAIGKTFKVKFSTAKDTIAPKSPIVNTVDDNDKTITGRAEAYGTVYIKKRGTLAGTAKVKADGSFSVGIPVQKAGTVLQVTVKDASGNVSKPTKIKVKDKTSPLKPKVNTVKSMSKTVTGKAEAGATVLIKKGKTIIGSAKSKPDQAFSLKIKAQKVKTVLSVIVKDEAGNESRAVKVVVKK